jgi:hypothetical protein
VSSCCITRNDCYWIWKRTFTKVTVNGRFWPIPAIELRVTLMAAMGQSETSRNHARNVSF